ncbi:MAG: N-acetyl sugar amidotransferase [Bacteroidota bacterium]
MTLVKQICARGVWDETIPGITFDENGVSNYAHLFDQLVEAYPRGDKGQNYWNDLVTKIKKKGRGKQYDCIIGVSGGTDSSYLLHLSREYGLNPLAVNLDNGWNSEIAVKNIKKMTSALNIDLETYVIEYEEIKDLLRSYMLAKLPWIDTPTDLSIKAILYKIALREGIKYIFRGNDFRSEGSQPKEWTYGDGRQLLAVHKKFGKVKLKTFPNYTLFNLFYYGFFRKIKSVYPYYYINYNKTNAQNFLINTYGWKYYGGHHYENSFTKFAISYWMYKKFGIDKRKITYSSLILSGEIERDYALKQLAQPPYTKEDVEPMLVFVLKKLDLTRKQLDEIMEPPNCSYLDYPSYNFILTTMLKIAKPFLSLIFLHKPQSVFQTEMRNQSSTQ